MGAKESPLGGGFWCHSNVVVVSVAWRVGSGKLALDARDVGSSQAASLAQPETWRVADDTLTVFDARGQRIWAYRFPFLLEQPAYGPLQRPFENPGLVRIVDLEGDGTLEVVFVANAAPGIHDEHRLYCFEHDGRVRFTYAPTATVRFGGDDYGAPFAVRYLRVTQNPDRSHSIWIGASHIQRFPSVIQKLDSSGAARGQYWLNGHIGAIRDVTLAGHRVLLVGGTTNEDRSASLAVIDYERPSGRAPSLTSKFQCSSCPQIDPLAFFVFPRIELARHVDVPAYVVEIKSQPDGGVLVTVVQAEVPVEGLPRPVPTTTYYRFAADMRLVETVVGDDYRRIHRLLEAAGFLNHAFGPRDERELFPIRKWNGTTFERLSLDIALPSGKQAS